MIVAVTPVIPLYKMRWIDVIIAEKKLKTYPTRAEPSVSLVTVDQLLASYLCWTETMAGFVFHLLLLFTPLLPNLYSTAVPCSSV